LKNPIYIEVEPLVHQKLTGVGRYTARLVQALARRGPLRLVTTFHAEKAWEAGLRPELVCGQEIALDNTNSPSADCDIDEWRLRTLRLPKQKHDRELAARSAGIYTFMRKPVRHFRREIGILYDFTPLVVPWAHLDEMRRAFSDFTTSSAALFDGYIAISESTKLDAAWLSPITAEKITVRYPGPSQCADTHAYIQPVTRRKHTLLTVSTVEPRKNPAFLIEWFLNSKVLEPETELLWVGQKGWLCDFKKFERQSRRGRRVNFLGKVSDADLCRLFREAIATVYPSLYEGFGYPVLDSLRHGTPVLSSFNSSLQEFVGPGVYYFNPHDPATLDEAYLQMRASGLARVERPDLEKSCSWNALADTVLAMCA
jgi:glycosyltransferase involved in cell wall biosynthesis